MPDTSFADMAEPIPHRPDPLAVPGLRYLPTASPIVDRCDFGHCPMRPDVVAVFEPAPLFGRIGEDRPVCLAHLAEFRRAGATPTVVRIAR